MNLLLDSAGWEDNDGNHPPIYWTGERYEVLIDNDGSPDGSFGLRRLTAADKDDRIIFSYAMADFDPQIGYTDPFLNIVDEDLDEVVFSVNLTTTPTGTIDFACTEGKIYSIVLAYSPTTYSSGSFYDLELVLTPSVEDAVVLPWWMCPPKEEVEPCPIRSTDFVPFSEYDEGFKFPLTSSRVPAKIVRPDDCIACRPTLIEPVEPEEPGGGDGDGGDA